MRLPLIVKTSRWMNLSRPAACAHRIRKIVRRYFAAMLFMSIVFLRLHWNASCPPARSETLSMLHRRMLSEVNVWLYAATKICRFLRSLPSSIQPHLDAHVIQSNVHAANGITINMCIQRASWGLIHYADDVRCARAMLKQMIHKCHASMCEARQMKVKTNVICCQKAFHRFLQFIAFYSAFDGKRMWFLWIVCWMWF